MTYTYWYIQSYLRQHGFLRVGKVKKDIKINHENQINQYTAGSSDLYWNMPTCTAKKAAGNEEINLGDEKINLGD